MKKRILYVATVDMFTPSGGAFATKAYYQAFCNIFPNIVDLMHAEEYYRFLSLENQGNIILQKRKPWYIRLYYFLLGHTHRFYPDVIQYLRDNKSLYSHCIINGSTYAGDLIKEVQKMGVKVFVIHHNYEYDFHKDNKTIYCYKGLYMGGITKMERNAFLESDLNIFLTKKDLNTLHENYGTPKSKSIYIGCFDYKKEEVQTPISNSYNNTLVISGALDFYQSEHGILSFIEQIYSKYIKENTNVRLIITGRNPTTKIREVTYKYSDNIILYENPKDIYEIIKKGCIYLCPISIGSGIKLRIMDGLKLGMPILAHTNSHFGYEEFIEKPYFKLYSDYNSFKEELLKIIILYTNNQIIPSEIQADFSSVFGLKAGINRIIQNLVIEQ